MTFRDLQLAKPLLKAIDSVGYTHPTPIQQQAIPILLKGKDLLGCAQTGTGKTAAFSLPILQHLVSKPQSGKRKIKALVITPTRELALQIADNFTLYSQFTNIRSAVIFGGVKQHSQVSALKNGVDVLVATPGRLLDLIGQGFISLNSLEHFVLDEADQMLDMGFIHDMKKIIALLPHKRQSLFFSATMPPSIQTLSKKILNDYEEVSIKPEQTTAERVEQAVFFVHKRHKAGLLTHLIKENNMDSVLVFSRTKHGANKVVRLLERDGINAAPIHGNKSQAARQKALEGFKDGKVNVLVATDIAARGIDVSGLPYVINYDLPNVPETYVHRIGRTGRAGSSGQAWSFCHTDERPYLKDIERLIKQSIPAVKEHPFVGMEPEEEEQPQQNQGGGNRSRGRGPSNSGQSGPRRRSGGSSNSGNRSGGGNRGGGSGKKRGGFSANRNRNSNNSGE